MKKQVGSYRGHSIVVSVFLGILLVALLLYLDRILIPLLIIAFTEPDAGRLQLALDVTICFFVTLSLMYAVQFRSRPHGTAIAAVMAVAGCGFYLWEAGSVEGMLNSRYPLWYDALSFTKYPVAFFASFYGHKRT